MAGPDSPPSGTSPAPSSVPPGPRAPRPGLRRFLFGRPRDVEDPRVFQRVTQVAFLAWMGLGADSLSSSAYGPQEAFKALGEHTSLAVGLALLTAFTVFVIASAYRRIIEQFPSGGGGYMVATQLLGSGAGAVSGSALVIDYILTITTSIAAGGDAAFSLLPPSWQSWKVVAECAVIGLLLVMNLRGNPEPASLLKSVFVAFAVTHVLLIGGALASRGAQLPAIQQEVKSNFAHALATLGWAQLIGLFLRSYSMGAGTYTGLEAVSNGLLTLREPKVETGKRTMTLMAVSLALTAAGILLGYLLLHVTPQPDKTMNWALAHALAGELRWGGLPVGAVFVAATLIAETLLLCVAAQAGFIDGPRVMAHMARDSFLPHRFAQLSDRLTMQNGVVLMGGASLLALLATRGDVGQLVVMYSITVFVTFSLSQAAMCRFWLRDRAKHRDWRRQLVVHLVGFALCAFMLCVTVYEKFMHGGWFSLLVTGSLISLCFAIRAHYRDVQRKLKRLDEILTSLPSTSVTEPKKPDPSKPTAVLLVGSYSGLGVHSLLSIQRLFPNHFKNFIFVSIGVIDAATFKDHDEVEAVKRRTEDSLKKYVERAQYLGLASEYRYAVGTEAVTLATELCTEIGKAFPRALFFAGQLVFEEERWFLRLLHNETAYQIQRRLQFAGLNAMVLPVRVLGQVG